MSRLGTLLNCARAAPIRWSRSAGDGDERFHTGARFPTLDTLGPPVGVDVVTLLKQPR